MYFLKIGKEKSIKVLIVLIIEYSKIMWSSKHIYLNSPLHTLYRYTLTKFRCANHRLPVVKGRYSGIERKDRICKLCDLNRLGDEFHFLFECPKLNAERKIFLKPYYRIRPNTLKMSQLFNSENHKVLINLSKFCQKIMSLPQNNCWNVCIYFLFICKTNVYT